MEGGIDETRRFGIEDYVMREKAGTKSGRAWEGQEREQDYHACYKCLFEASVYTL